VILTGGSSKLKGIESVASRVFNLPVRLAIPNSITGLVDQIQGPEYSAVIGALKFVTKSRKEDTRIYGGKGGSMSKVTNKVVSFIKSFLP